MLQQDIIIKKQKKGENVKKLTFGKKMATKSKNTWFLIIFICAGLVIGGLIGQLSAQVSWLNWLAFGQEFGLSQPLVLDLSVLKITFGFVVNINMASIIGMVIALLIYRWI